MSDLGEQQSEEPVDLPYESISESAAKRGDDDRRHDVDPASAPAPHSPEPDQEAIRKGEETLERVNPH